MRKDTLCWLWVLIVSLGLIGCGREVWDVGLFSPTTAYSKQRHYEMETETVFKAAYQGARKTGLHVVKLDKQLGTIIASKQIGAYSSGWTDRYVIFLQADGENRTEVQIKYKPVRAGGLPLSSAHSAQSSTFVSTGWGASVRKVNHLFDQIQRELGIVDIFGIRGF